MSSPGSNRLPPASVVARALPHPWFAPAARPSLTCGQHHGLHHVVTRKSLHALVTAVDRIDQLCDWVTRGRLEGLAWCRHIADVSAGADEYTVAFDDGGQCRFSVTDRHPTSVRPDVFSTLPSDVRRVRWVPLFRGTQQPDPADVLRRAREWVAAEHRSDGLLVAAPDDLIDALTDAARRSTERHFCVELMIHRQWAQRDDGSADLLWIGEGPRESELVTALQRRDVVHGSGARLLVAPMTPAQTLAGVETMLAACGRPSDVRSAIARWRLAHDGLDEGVIVELAHHWAVPRAVAQTLLRQAGA